MELAGGRGSNGFRTTVVTGALGGGAEASGGEGGVTGFTGAAGGTGTEAVTSRGRGRSRGGASSTPLESEVAIGTGVESATSTTGREAGFSTFVGILVEKGRVSVESAAGGGGVTDNGAGVSSGVEFNIAMGVVVFGGSKAAPPSSAEPSNKTVRDGNFAITRLVLRTFAGYAAAAMLPSVVSGWRVMTRTVRRPVSFPENEGKSPEKTERT